jgi:hypothetical protein
MTHTPPRPWFPWRAVTCPHCLGAFPIGRRWFRCETGCRADNGTTPDARQEAGLVLPTGDALVFDPRQRADSRVVVRLLRHFRPTSQAACPQCERPTARAVCPLCGAELPAVGLGDPVVPLVVVGPRGAGKTVWVSVVLRDLEQRLGPARSFVIDPADAFTRRHASELQAAIDANAGRAAPGPRPNPPCDYHPDALRPLVFRYRGARSAWLSIFDTPGADWDERREVFVAGAPFVAASGAWAYLLDPTRLDAVDSELRRRDWDRPARRPRRQALDASSWRRVHPADEVRFLGTFLERAGRAFPADGSLALVLTKFELWGELAPPGTLLRALADGVPQAWPWDARTEQTLHEETEALLVRWAGETFLQQLDRKFPRHRFFAASSLGQPPADDGTIVMPPVPFAALAPALWVLREQGFDLEAGRMPQR